MAVTDKQLHDLAIIAKGIGYRSARVGLAQEPSPTVIAALAIESAAESGMVTDDEFHSPVAIEDLADRQDFEDLAFAYGNGYAMGLGARAALGPIEVPA